MSRLLHADSFLFAQRSPASACFLHPPALHCHPPTATDDEMLSEVNPTEQYPPIPGHVTTIPTNMPFLSSQMGSIVRREQEAAAAAAAAGIHARAGRIDGGEGITPRQRSLLDCARVQERSHFHADKPFDVRIPLPLPPQDSESDRQPCLAWTGISACPTMAGA